MTWTLKCGSAAYIREHEGVLYEVSSKQPAEWTLRQDGALRGKYRTMRECMRETETGGGRPRKTQ